MKKLLEIDTNSLEISMYPKDTVTLWIHDEKEKSCKQMEIRITPNKKIEIFVNNFDVKIKSFTNWYNMNDKE